MRKMHEVKRRLLHLRGCKYCADAVKVSFKSDTCMCKYDDCPYENEITANDISFPLYEKVMCNHTYPANSKIYTNSGEYAHAEVNAQRRAAFINSL